MNTRGYFVGLLLFSIKTTRSGKGEISRALIILLFLSVLCYVHALCDADVECALSTGMQVYSNCSCAQYGPCPSELSSSLVYHDSQFNIERGIPF
jgi:hypothetical protein